MHPRVDPHFSQAYDRAMRQNLVPTPSAPLAEEILGQAVPHRVTPAIIPAIAGPSLISEAVVLFLIFKFQSRLPGFIFTS